MNLSNVKEYNNGRNRKYEGRGFPIDVGTILFSLMAFDGIKKTQVAHMTLHNP